MIFLVSTDMKIDKAVRFLTGKLHDWERVDHNYLIENFKNFSAGDYEASYYIHELVQMGFLTVERDQMSEITGRHIIIYTINREKLEGLHE